MNKDIENIIKKFLPEKKKLNKITKLIEENIYLIAVNKGRNLSTTQYEVAKDNLSSQFNELMNINTSLIADEVLKVVVETTKRELEEQINHIKNTSEGTQDWYEGIRVIKSLVLNYLSNLSTNKEN